METYKLPIQNPKFEIIFFTKEEFTQTLKDLFADKLNFDHLYCNKSENIDESLLVNIIDEIKPKSHWNSKTGKYYPVYNESSELLNFAETLKESFLTLSNLPYCRILKLKQVKETVLSEHELDDDYPVYFNYLYVCDGKVIRSDIQGTVKKLKTDLRTHLKLEAKIITNCDIEGRQKLLNKN
jgi:hypothetical protein